MTLIAGKPTSVGDELYHAGLRLWATVIEPGVVAIHGVNDQVARYGFQTGGFINGKKQLYWHMPLVFESSSRDITKYQALINEAYKNFGDQ